MPRRRTSRASSTTLSRFSFSGRTFDEQIEELTKRSIAESLKEIDEQLEERFGEPKKSKRGRAPDDIH